MTSTCPRLLRVYLPVLSLSLCCGAQEFPFFEPVQPPRPFQVMAHGGEGGQAPPDSKAALRRCFEDGLEWAEVEVRLTRDGHHILAQGPQVQGADGRTLDVSEHTLDELLGLEVGSAFAARYASERVLPLVDCLQLAKGKLNLCLHCNTIAPAQLAREILEAGMERQVVLHADADQLSKLQAASESKLALMGRWQPGMAIPAWARTNHLAAVEIASSEATSAVCREFHAAGIKVEAGCLRQSDHSEVWDRVQAAGVDWIQTDLPEELVAHALWQRLKTRPVLFSLHRGANRYAPENTLPAFEKGIRLGADFVEFDVRTTSDGKFYLLHDSVLDGKTDGHGPIAATPSSVIATLSAGVKFRRAFAKVGLPTLDDFLTTVEGKVNLYFDAKAIPPEILSEAVERHHLAERTVVYQSLDYLLKLKAINPRIRALPPLGAPDELAPLAEKLKPYAVDTQWNILSRDLIARCHALGILVFSDALGSHERIEDYLQAMDWGIDLIQTDHPLRLMRAIELRAAKVR